MNHKVILAFVLLICSVIIADTILLEPGNRIASPGSVNVSVPIEMTNLDPVAIFTFDVRHSSHLTFKSVQNTSRSQNAQIEAMPLNSTLVRLAGFVQNNISYGTGPILDIFFDVGSQAPPGFYPIELENVAATNLNIDEIPITTETGIFTII